MRETFYAQTASQPSRPSEPEPNERGGAARGRAEGMRDGGDRKAQAEAMIAKRIQEAKTSGQPRSREAMAAFVERMRTKIQDVRARRKARRQQGRDGGDERINPGVPVVNREVVLPPAAS